MRIFTLLSAVAALFFATEHTALAQRRRIATNSNGASEFDCPEEFGYYPHPTDCTQYYVCVFGGALLESCTGGLMYSHELQTCDWPRNVGCGEGVGGSPGAGEPSHQGVSTVRVTDARTRDWRNGASTPVAPARPAQQPQQVHHQQNQYDDVAGEEEIVDRQQRVYRGQPNSVGQVARDRDGLHLNVPNSIPLAVRGRSAVVDKSSDYSNQYSRPAAPEPTVQEYIPTVTAPSASNTTYGDYPEYYDDGYKGEYIQQYSGHQQQNLNSQSSYKAQPTAAAASPAPQQNYRTQSYTPEPISNQQYPVNSYDYESYQTDDKLVYEPEPSPQAPTRSSGRTSSQAETQRTVARGSSASDLSREQTDRQQRAYANRGSTRAKASSNETPLKNVKEEADDLPSGGYDSDNRVSESPPVSSRTRSGGSSNRNRGSVKSSSARPTLKPATSIVTKSTEYVDIFRFPPSRPDPVYPTPRVDQTAAKCRKDVCLLPDCYCGGKEVPNGYAPEQIPQIVLLTFDDSVNDLNKGLYESLFERGRVNPNGCPISATFYVSHEWTDYSQVQNLYADGHEMASHSISHSFGEQFSQKKWTREIAGQREILASYGGVRLEDVRGMRAPFLAIGGNKMFKMLYDANFTYDSSMPVYENRPPSFPYTLDYKLFHDCMIPPCPTKSYPGVWEVPMVMWQDLNGGRCSMGDACSNPPTADGVYKMLIKNFERHYTTNRAPFGLYYHAAWFTHPHHKEGFEAFLDTIVAMDDVWLVTNWQAIQWMRDPQPLNTVKNFAPFGCNYPERPKRCNSAKVCNLWHKSGVRYMRTCQPCPEIYPWTGKTGVRNSRADNNEIEE